jgi:hypothetical protein
MLRLAAIRLCSSVPRVIYGSSGELWHGSDGIASPNICDLSDIGSIFLFFGVLMFFDRAMYVSALLGPQCVICETNLTNFPFLQARNGKCTIPFPLSILFPMYPF